jgi:RNA polymerase sigma-70 factor (ECF subfamily)
LERLLAQHRQTVFRYGLRFCKTSEDAEDAVQETLWAATRSLANFRRAASITTWLFTIVRNKCHRLLTHRPSEPDLAELLPFIPDTRMPIEAQIATEQIERILADALAQLDPLQRQVIMLRDVEGMTAPEAAARLSISVSALKSRLHRARDELRSLVRSLHPVAL